MATTQSPPASAARDWDVRRVIAFFDRIFPPPRAFTLHLWDGTVLPAEEDSRLTLTLNTRPRKTLGWRTPAEALDEFLRSAHTDSVATTG